MIELAPGRFSTITGWPMFCETLAATRRVTPSAPPPGGKPTTQLIGFEGYADCARAPNGAMTAVAAISNCRLLIVLLLCRTRSSIEVETARRVGRGTFALARPDVDGARRAMLRERGREERQIDAQSPAALEGAQAIVPP